MSSKEFEPEALGVPQISKKTGDQLKEFSKQRWQSNDRRRVAADIIKNGQELLAGSNTDWEFVLKNIRVQQVNNVQSGEAAIAMRDAHLIGALAAGANWSMHDPAIVYLSAKCLVNGGNDKLEGFKSTMRKAAVAYGQKVFPNPDLYMETLDFLLELRDRNNYRSLIKQLLGLLADGNIEEAYKIVRSREDLVKRRG